MKHNDPPFYRSRKLIVLVLALMIAAAVLVALRGFLPPSRDGRSKLASGGHTPAERRNLLLLTLDTTRADRIGCYGYEAARTPALDRIAERGVAFDAAYAVTPLTLPSHTTILTGLYPVFHGVRNNGRYELPGEYTTLAEMFREGGWRTGAFISAFVLHSRFGLAQGFESFGDDLTAGHPKLTSMEIQSRSGQQTVEDALAWLRETHRRKFFLWVHFFDPHMPYRAPRKFQEAFSHNPYDGQIAYMDSVIGTLISRLERWGVLRDTLVVVIADHGESLGEHGEQTHAFFIYNAAMRVPLIFSQPGVLPEGKRLDASVSMADVAPTVLEYFGLPAPPELQGKSFLDAMQGSAVLDHRSVLIESVFPFEAYNWAPLSGLLHGSEKYIKAPQPEYYDLARDPNETANLWDDQPQRRASLVKRYEETFEKLRKAENETVSSRRAMSEEEEETLRSLGYVFGARESRAEPADLRDPKDAIAMHELLRDAENLQNVSDLDGMQRDLENIMKKDPTNYQAVYILASLHEMKGRWDEALPLYEKAIRLRPKKGMAWIGIGRYHMERGDSSKAKEHFLMATNDKHCSDAYVMLSLLYGREGDLDGAMKTLREGEKLYPFSERIHNNLGIVYVQKGLKDLAREHFQKAIALKKDFEDARRNLALLNAN